MNIKSVHFLPGTNRCPGDKYLLFECLGDGSHGWAWWAERLRDGKVAAVEISKDIIWEDRQLAEGKELLNVEPHENIAQIFGVGRVDSEWFYIEMEYFPSRALVQKLDDRQRNFGQTHERPFGIYRQVFCAVCHLVELPVPISHGDIKSHNILAGGRDLVKLTGFGSSALPEEVYVRTRESGGTVLHSAPEFSNVDSRRGSLEELLLGDTYSLGVLLYQLLTGKLPHDTSTQAQRHVPLKLPVKISSFIHMDLEQVVLTCLQKRVEDRFPTISDLIYVFDPAATKQLKVGAIAPAFQTKPAQDWSSVVLEAISDQSYQKAAQLASQGYSRNKDLQALHQQLTTSYHVNRLFDFGGVVEDNKAILLGGRLTQLAALFELIAKVSLQLRNISQVNFWLLQRK